MSALALIAVGCSSTSKSNTANGTTPAGSTTIAARTAAGGAVCKGSVKFGVAYISDGAAAAAAASGKPPDPTGAAAAAAAIQAQFTKGLDYLNAHGGWAGCTVDPVYFQFHILGSDFNQQDQQMCTTFTTDNHVFAAINWITNDTPLLLQCMSQKQVPVIWDSDQFQLDNALYQKYAGYVYQPTGISYDRWGAFIDTLNAVGTIGASSKVGLLVADNGAGAETHLANDVLSPRLAALKIPVTTFTYSNILGFQGLSDVSTKMSAAVLKFKAAGVNTVIITPSASVSSLEFSTAAASQGYFPTYIGNSLEAPNSYLTAQEKTTAAAVMWQPGRDALPPEPATVAAGNPPDAAKTLCDQIYTGQAAPPYDFCDAMFFIQQALTKAPAMSSAGLRAGVEALGTSFQSALGYGPTNFGKDRYDGGEEIRVMTWDPQLKAFNYADQPVKIP